MWNLIRTIPVVWRLLCFLCSISLRVLYVDVLQAIRELSIARIQTKHMHRHLEQNNNKIHLEYFRWIPAVTILAREFRLYMDCDKLMGPLSVWELSCVEMGDIVCTCTYTQFDLICVRFHHMTNFKWIFSNVKINSESIVGVVFHAHNLQRCILMNVHFNA